MGLPVSFNAHHSPVGAYLTFTCGHFGTRGGLAAQLGKPAGQDIYIGYKDADRYTRSPLLTLPFFDGADKIDPLTAFTLEQSRRNDPERFSPFTAGNLSRRYSWSTDRWKSAEGALEFSIYTPWVDLPDPATASADEVRNALLPAVMAEIILDNREGKQAKTGFFAINFHDPGNRVLEKLSDGRIGLAHRAHYGFAAELFDMPEKGCPAHPENGLPAEPPRPFPFLRWWPHEGIEDRSNPVHLLGTTPGIGFEVPPGKRYTLRVALGCYFPEIVTTRLEGRYLYTGYYTSLEDVLSSALDRFCDLKQIAKSQDRLLANSGLSEDQQFLIAHSTRSYYANTQLLEVEGAPYWIVNEGEYCMMNTLDLSVDQVFWELERNPWVVRNLLDNFLKHYSYTDEVKIETTESTESTESSEEKRSVVPKTAPGGISFCHDQGSNNQFSPFGRSSYELKDLTGCFSYMTQEQLCNWILIAASYVLHTGDTLWLSQNAGPLSDCLKSLYARTNGIHGVMTFDSALCGSGQEITTYDSLDASLGQARQNLYLALKCWASHWALTALREIRTGTPSTKEVLEEHHAREAALAAYVTSEKVLPAILDPHATGHHARILAAVEAMLFPLIWSHSTFPAAQLPTANMHPNLLTTLRTHTITLLSDPAHRNHFPDGGVKLSSTSNNSWLSKIAIVQHVARSLFNLDENGNTRCVATPPNTGEGGNERRVAALKEEGAAERAGASGWEKADAAHVKWLTTGPGAYWCACDQIVSGEARGSKYYPRLITTALWLQEVRKPAR